MRNHQKVYIIILNWNGLKDTLECLESVYKLDYPNFEAIVVDNASLDNSIDVISNLYPNTILIKNSENLGFTGGNNVAMRYAMERDADYMWLLNNDTVVETDTLSKLVELSESSNNIGLVSPIIFYFDAPSKVQSSGRYFHWETFTTIDSCSAKDVDKIFQSGNRVCLWGTALLIKRNVVEKIGFLKEEYFAYWEDTEYSLRAIGNGFQNRICNSSKIFHKYPSNPSEWDSNKRPFFTYFMRRNKILMGNDHIKSFPKRLGFKIKTLADLSNDLRHCDPKKRDVCFDAVWHGLHRISGPWKNDVHMPILYKKILLILSHCYPIFLSDLLRLDFGEVFRKIKKKLILIGTLFH